MRRFGAISFLRLISGRLQLIGFGMSALASFLRIGFFKSAPLLTFSGFMTRFIARLFTIIPSKSSCSARGYFSPGTIFLLVIS